MNRYFAPLLAGIILSFTAQISPAMIITDLGHLGGNYSWPSALNNQGQVVGASTTADGAMHCFIWEKGTMSDLGDLGGNYCYAVAINDRGWVVGYSRPSTSDELIRHAFFWSKNTGMIDLGTYQGTLISEARGINNNGQIIGRSWTFGGASYGFIAQPQDTDADGIPDKFELVPLLGPGVYGITASDINDGGIISGYGVTATSVARALIWQNETVTPLGVLAPTWPGAWSFGRAINNFGQVIGDAITAPPPEGEVHAFWWNGMIMHDLGKPECCDNSWPVAISDIGLITGYSFLYSGNDTYSKALLWDIKSQPITLTVLPDLQADPGSSSAGSINGSGKVVGSSLKAGHQHAVLWPSSTQIIDLGTLSGFVSSGAVAINEPGQIVGWSSDGSVTHAVIWDPVLTVSIDIKPGDPNNTINIGSAGAIPVAILSTQSFDARTVNPATITLAGATVRMVGQAGRYLCSAEDVNKDGLDDLVCHITTNQAMLVIGSSVAVLKAATYDGHEIRGEDTVRIVPDK